MNNFYETSKNSIIRLKNFIRSHFTTIFFLLLLTIIVSLITYYRILVQLHIGPISDSVDFFTDALVFAGQGFGYADLTRPPLFPLITSLFVRIGYTSINTIFYIDGGSFLFGVIGLFLLLKIKFNDLESFLGGLLYATFPITLTILGFGFSDLSSVSFSIWAIYFLVLAVKKDSKFFFLMFPFALFAFLARYNNALLIFPILLYLLINKDKINLKNILIGIIASILVIIPVLLFFYEKFGNVLYTLLNFSSTSTISTGSYVSAIYNPNILFFVERFPSFTGPQGITITLIVAFGGLTFILIRLMKIKLNKDLLKAYSQNKIIKIELLLFVFLSIIFLVSFGKTLYYVSELIFFVMAYLFYDITKNLNIKNMDLHIMFFTWFMAFFIFSSVFVIKDNRYFLLMAPSVAYFMILGLSIISNSLKFMFKNRDVFPIFAILLTSIILLSTATQIPNVMNANNDKTTANQQIEQASQWFVSYDPDYKNQNIYSDLWPNFSWNLKTDVKPVPIFKDNQVFKDGGVVNNTFNQNDSDAFNNYLVTNNAEYYFCVRPGLNLTSYKPIKRFGIVTIYEKI